MAVRVAVEGDWGLPVKLVGLHCGVYEGQLW